MLRRTYGSVRNELARVCGSTGMGSSDPRVMEYTNQAIEELLSSGEWASAVDRLKFTLTNCKFVLPSDYDRMLYCTLDGAPLQMQSPWYEFVGYGLELFNTASIPSDGTGLNQQRYMGVIDKDTAATFQEIPVGDGNTYYPRVYAQTDERIDGQRPSIVIQGYDENGDWVKSPDGVGGFIDGVSIEINGDTAPYYIQSTQAFSYVSATIKPVTKKNVMLWAFTVDGSIGHYIGQYASGDTTPFYRQYSIPALRFTDDQPVRTILARLRRRYVPIRSDADFLLITNLPALKAMLQAVYYRETNDIANSTAYRQVAVKLLQEEQKAYIGLSNQKPLMTISEGAGQRFDGIYIL